MRLPTGRIRFLALALATAIAWPAGLPVGSGVWGSSRLAHPCPELGRSAGRPSLKQLVPDDSLCRSSRVGFADQSEESDEKDDAKPFAPAVGFAAESLIPSLIPVVLTVHGPAAVPPALALGATGRLRC